MKFFKLIAAAFLLSAALVQSASAQAGTGSGTAGSPYLVYITGSSAFRTAVLGQIAPTSGNGIWDSASGISECNDSANATSVAANTNNTTFAIEGGSISGTFVNIYATFTGSVSGIFTVAGSQTVPFLKLGSATTAFPGTLASPNTGAPSAFQDSSSSQPNTGTNIATTIPDFCFSDCFQTSTVYKGLLNTAQTGTISFATLTDYTGGSQVLGISGVGIVTFKFVASTGFSLGSYTSGTSSSYSMTGKLFGSYFATGYGQVSQMTGLVSDQNNEFICVGRNPDSGTRINALADTGLGTAHTVVQYQQDAITSGNVTSLQLWPTTSPYYVGGNLVLAGNNGAGSGADLRVYGGYTLTAAAAGAQTGHTPTNAYFLMYLGISDAKTAEAYTSVGGTEVGPAVELAYNGVNYSTQAIYNGSYSYWGYEHMYRRTAITTGPSAVYNAVGGLLTATANAQSSAITGAGLSLADTGMLVKRSSDGATIGPDTRFPY